MHVVDSLVNRYSLLIPVDVHFRCEMTRGCFGEPQRQRTVRHRVTLLRHCVPSSRELEQAQRQVNLSIRASKHTALLKYTCTCA